MLTIHAYNPHYFTHNLFLFLSQLLLCVCNAAFTETLPLERSSIAKANLKFTKLCTVALFGRTYVQFMTFYYCS